MVEKAANPKAKRNLPKGMPYPKGEHLGEPLPMRAMR